jgi:hypothetical protein
MNISGEGSCGDIVRGVEGRTYIFANLQELDNIVFSDMIDASHRGLVVGNSLEVT